MDFISMKGFPSNSGEILLPFTWLFIFGEIREGFSSEEMLVTSNWPFPISEFGWQNKTYKATLRELVLFVNVTLTKAKGRTQTARFIVL